MAWILGISFPVPSGLLSGWDVLRAMEHTVQSFPLLLQCPLPWYHCPFPLQTTQHVQVYACVCGHGKRLFYRNIFCGLVCSFVWPVVVENPFVPGAVTKFPVLEGLLSKKVAFAVKTQESQGRCEEWVLGGPTQWEKASLKRLPLWPRERGEVIHNPGWKGIPGSGHHLWV